MTEEQADLLKRARESATAAQQLHELGHAGFAASRAYYGMFYVAQALLLGKGLAFSKHSAVIAAFGEHFAKTEALPVRFHQYLIRGMEARHAGDYGSRDSVTPDEAQQQIDHVAEFLDLAEQFIGTPPPES